MLKEAQQLKPFVEEIKKYQEEIQVERDLESILADPQSDKELIAMANLDKNNLKTQLEQVEKNIIKYLMIKDEDDNGNAIMEFRPGTGGLEAGLFAMEIYKMYKQYCESKGWIFESVSLTESNLDGLKEATVIVKGDLSYSTLKYEVGVHRVQRVPETETMGRLQTSTMSIVVLPEVEDSDFELKNSDLKIETKKASGPGGQHVNTTDSAVRITHIPTGLVISMQDDRSQHKNKAKALKILQAKVYDLEKSKTDKLRAQVRRNQIGTADRSERIRTFNYPQDRITEHRIGKSWYGISSMLSGEILDDIIENLKSAEMENMLKELTKKD